MSNADPMSIGSTYPTIPPHKSNAGYREQDNAVQDPHQNTGYGLEQFG